MDAFDVLVASGAAGYAVVVGESGAVLREAGRETYSDSGEFGVLGMATLMAAEQLSTRAGHGKPTEVLVRGEEQSLLLRGTREGSVIVAAFQSSAADYERLQMLLAEACASN